MSASASLIPLHALLARGRAADALVGHDGQRFWFWSDWAAAVAHHAAHYRASPAQRWLLVADGVLPFSVQLMALLHAGKTVLLPPNSLPGTVESLQGQFDACTDSALINSALADADGDLPATPWPLLDADSLEIVLYTSGSTGVPKPIRKTLAQLEREVDLLHAQWQTDGTDKSGMASMVVVGTAPPQHLYGLTFRVLWPLSAGWPTDGVTCADPHTLLQRLEVLGQQGIPGQQGSEARSLLVTSPAQLSRWPGLIDMATLRPHLGLVLSAGGPVSAALAQELVACWGTAPREIFGSSETGVIAWRCQNPALPPADSEAWQPFAGMQVSADADGALLLRSPLLGNGADSMPPYRMDDAIALRPDGRFALLGRLDRTIKLEEKRLYLPDMEARLAQFAGASGGSAYPGVRAAAVVLIPATARAGSGRSVLGAVVQTDRALAAAERPLLAQALRAHLAQYFDRVLLPRRWRFVESLPYNERGKIPTAALLALFEDHDS